jgi:hypothetical protein
LLVDEKLADEGVFEGDGSCSLLTPRWKTDSTTAWGIGPLYTALPGIKTLDVLSELVLRQLSFAVDPARRYDNDGMINPENGINPGDWIPSQPGSKIEEIGSDADFDTSFYERKDMQTDIKRVLFQDGPVQTGDTPPTAFQWNDQNAKEAQRMGAPFGRLKTEWQIAVFVRFVYLLQKRGVIPKTFNIRSPKIRLRTTSPLIQAKRRQQVSASAQLLQGAIAMFGPQFVMSNVKGSETWANMIAAIGDKLIVNTSRRSTSLPPEHDAAGASRGTAARYSRHSTASARRHAMTAETRTFDRLRSRAKNPPSPEQEVVALALGKIARTPEGEVVFGYMRNWVERVMPPDASDGALREMMGAKRLFAHLEALIASGESNSKRLG